MLSATKYELIEDFVAIIDDVKHFKFYQKAVYAADLLPIHFKLKVYVRKSVLLNIY